MATLEQDADEINRQTEKDSAILAPVLPKLEAKFEDKRSGLPLDARLVSSYFREVVNVYDGDESKRFMYYVTKLNGCGVLPITGVVREGQPKLFLVGDLETMNVMGATDVILLEAVKAGTVDLDTVLLRTQRALRNIERADMAKMIQDGLERVRTTKFQKPDLFGALSRTRTTEGEALFNTWQERRRGGLLAYMLQVNVVKKIPHSS